MHAKHFFENFWMPEQKNELFVCMPFDSSFDDKFAKIDEIAKKIGFEKAIRTKEGWMANDIVHEILDGIANSKFLLFDLSIDPRTSGVNNNVLYELGIADSIREPEDIFLIKENSNIDMPFDTSHIRYNTYDNELNEQWLENKIKLAVDNQKWYKSKRVEAAAKSIDGVGFELILEFYKKRPLGHDHFNDDVIGTEPRIKSAILRLLDLGILWFATEKRDDVYGWAYHWTPFGREVIKYLNIEKDK